MRGRLTLVTLVCVFALACEGGGSGGGGLVVESEPIDARCTPFPRSFPSGLSLLSDAARQAIVALPDPPTVWSLDLEAERPRILAVTNLGTDSDGDGVDDEVAMRNLLGFPLGPITGRVDAPRDDLALVSTSSYEQVALFDASSAQPRGVMVETPPATPSGRYPLLPPPGDSALRTAVSTLACIFPRDPFDSAGMPIAGATVCDPNVPSYLSSFTAGKAVAAGRLFVATSNFAGGNRFRPGTVLVYEWIDGGGTPQVRPDTATPYLFTERFNPTGVARVVTPDRRELVLVTTSGAIGQGTGAANVVTEAAIEVIDPTVPRIAAVVPLGFAGPSFEAIAVDPTRRVGWLGASSQNRLYAVDLRALDDARLYAGAGPPILLDGLTPGFPDARIFSADAPLVLPERADGAPPADCEGFTHVATNDAGSEVFATDFCDGTFTRVRMDLTGNPAIPWPADRFVVASQQTPFAAVRSDTFGLLRAPGALAVRPGEPAVDYTTPDVLVIAGQPEGQLCALRVESR